MDNWLKKNIIPFSSRVHLITLWSTSSSPYTISAPYSAANNRKGSVPWKIHITWIEHQNVLFLYKPREYKKVTMMAPSENKLINAELSLMFLINHNRHSFEGCIDYSQDLTQDHSNIWYVVLQLHKTAVCLSLSFVFWRSMRKYAQSQEKSPIKQSDMLDPST